MEYVVVFHVLCKYIYIIYELLKFRVFFVCFADRVALVAPPTYAHHYYPYCYYPPHHGAGGGVGGGVSGAGGGGGHHGGGAGHQQPIYSRCPPGKETKKKNYTISL